MILIVSLFGWNKTGHPGFFAKPLRVFVNFEKSCILIYNRVYSSIFSEKKLRKFEFQFTQYKE